MLLGSGKSFCWFYGSVLCWPRQPNEPPTIRCFSVMKCFAPSELWMLSWKSIAVEAVHFWKSKLCRIASFASFSVLSVFLKRFFFYCSQDGVVDARGGGSGPGDNGLGAGGESTKDGTEEVEAKANAGGNEKEEEEEEEGEESATFPLYTRALEYICHGDFHVRIAALTVVLNIYNQRDPLVRAYLNGPAARSASLPDRLVGALRSQCLVLADSAMAAGAGGSGGGEGRRGGVGGGRGGGGAGGAAAIDPTICRDSIAGLQDQVGVCAWRVFLISIDQPCQPADR